MIRIKLMRCFDKYYCKTNQEITDFFTGKYLMLLNNQIRFDENFYGQDAIIHESVVHWIPISTMTKRMNVFEVKR